MRTRREQSSSQSKRLAIYLDRLSQVAGHADRVLPMQNYTKGLFLPIQRKSVEPMAARLAPANVRRMHQSLHHIVAGQPGAMRPCSVRFAVKCCPP